MESLDASHNESIDLVEEWFNYHDTHPANRDFSPTRDWIKLAIPVNLAEKMLGTVTATRLWSLRPVLSGRTMRLVITS